jgi:hypothetical protein
VGDCPSMSGLVVVQGRRAVAAMALHAADDVVRKGACDADEDDTAANQTDHPFNAGAGQREHEPGEEGDDTGDEDHHAKRPPHAPTFGA